MSNYPNIAINTKNGVEFINMDDILYCSSNGNYTNIHLKNNQKMCLGMFYLEGKSYADIAMELNFSLKDVKSHIQNGKRNLKLKLSGTG